MTVIQGFLPKPYHSFKYEVQSCRWSNARQVPVGTPEAEQRGAVHSCSSSLCPVRGLA